MWLRDTPAAWQAEMIAIQELAHPLLLFPSMAAWSTMNSTSEETDASFFSNTCLIAPANGQMCTYRCMYMHTHSRYNSACLKLSSWRLLVVLCSVALVQFQCWNSWNPSCPSFKKWSANCEPLQTHSQPPTIPLSTTMYVDRANFYVRASHGSRPVLTSQPVYCLLILFSWTIIVASFPLKVTIV